LKVRLSLAHQFGTGLFLPLLTLAALAQQRPDSGVLLNEKPWPKNLPELNSSTPNVVVPQVRRAMSVKDQRGWDEKVRVTGFQITGNTLFNSEILLAQIPGIKGEVVEISRIVDALESIRKYYADAGYLLTDVYLPEQQISAKGAVVQIAVVEARIGKLIVHIAPGSGVSEQHVLELANENLRPRTAIQKYELEKVVYILKDRAGVDASASLTAGANIGEADITIDVFPSGSSRVGTSLMLDNQGVRSAGEYRVTASVNVDNPFDIGDQFSFRLQPTRKSGNGFFRVGYTAPIGSGGTKLNLSVGSNVYVLGAPFEALEPSGSATVFSATVIHPLIRGRLTNVVAIGGVDFKELNDNNRFTEEFNQKISAVRVGLLGNSTSDQTHAAGVGTSASEFSSHGGITVYSVVATAGSVTMSPDAPARVDGSLGSFSTLNFDVQRVQFFSSELSMSLSLKGQMASKNLRGSERVSYGGPTGVRGYPAASGVGDEGILASAELRYRTPFQVLGSPLTAMVFYDTASVIAKKNPLPESTSSNSANSANFDSVGLGFQAGKEGRSAASLSIARRLGSTYPIPTDGVGASLESDRGSQAWFTLQKWF